MDEHIFAAILAGNEAKPLGVVKPLHLSDDQDRSRGIGGDPARPKPIARGPLWALDNASGVNFQHPRHLRSLGARADLDAQFGARGNGVGAGGRQGVGMQERVALAARQLDESVTFVRLEPFHDRVDRRRARIDRRSGSPPGRAPKTAPVWTAAEASSRPRPRLVRHRPIVIEPAFARRPKVLTLAHVSPKSPPKT